MADTAKHTPVETELLKALNRIQRISAGCEVLPDTDGLRGAYRDIDVIARIAIAKAEARS